MPVPAMPVPAMPVPAMPVPAGPVPAGPVPAGPVPVMPVPAGPVPAGPVPAGPAVKCPHHGPDTSPYTMEYIKNNTRQYLINEPANRKEHLAILRAIHPDKNNLNNECKEVAGLKTSCATTTNFDDLDKNCVPIDLKEKYLKYKQKYLSLKKELNM
jgi:hypothetical protein